MDRLLHTIRQRLSEKLQQRVDPEDILQSAWISFFEGNFEVQTEDQLLGLITQICVQKTRDAARWHDAAKRRVALQMSGADLEKGRKPHPMHRERIGAGEEAFDEPFFEHDSVVDEDSVRLMAAGASPVHGSMLLELLERLPESMRNILVLKLKGMTDAEIAEKLGFTRRTVVRRLSLIRTWLSNELRCARDHVEDSTKLSR